MSLVWELERGALKWLWPKNERMRWIFYCSILPWKMKLYKNYTGNIHTYIYACVCECKFFCAFNPIKSPTDQMALPFIAFAFQRSCLRISGKNKKKIKHTRSPSFVENPWKIKWGFASDILPASGISWRITTLLSVK